MECPRVLVISHTSFTKADSMGSTLASYLTTYDQDCVAQFYIKNMIPDIGVCNRYYRVTDEELINKFIHPINGKVGKRICNNTDNSTNSKAASASPIGSHKHRDIAMLARKFLWSIGGWNTKEFREWLAEFSPQVIVVQPGDFSYLIDIAVRLARKYEIPIVVHQSESYYLKEYEKNDLIYRYFRYDFKKSYQRLMRHTSCCVYLCKALEESYCNHFSVRSVTIMKSTNIVPNLSTKAFDKSNIRFIYGGNLGEAVGRCVPLLELGKAIKRIGSHIDVYTNSNGEHMKLLTPENGILLHGPLAYDELQKEIKKSDFVMHMESQNPSNIKDLEYAFSTKIADMLASGVCSVVYGSDKVASIRYFKDNKLGCVIERQEDIEPVLRELIADDLLRSKYISRALIQAREEHNPTENSEHMRKVICDAYERGFCANW